MITLVEFEMILQAVAGIFAQSFTVLDQAVFIEFPRISLLDLFAAIVFLNITFRFFSWLRGSPSASQGEGLNRQGGYGRKPYGPRRGG